MQKLPLKLKKRLEKRKLNNSFRTLAEDQNLTDFASNDYLGLATSKGVFEQTNKILAEFNLEKNGATGSRLLTGNHKLFKFTEEFLAGFHQVQAGLIFNSGYDANLGLLASLPQRGDIILFDELAHASIREAILLSHARSFKFRHNDTGDLELQLKKYSTQGEGDIYVVTESIFSMDGDFAPLEKIAALAEQHQSYLIVDEAHSTGIFGKKGEGYIAELGLQEKVFARVNTFGKAVGCHGAVVLGSEELKSFLVNFARSFIYTTALPPHSVANILAVYQNFEKGFSEAEKLRVGINFFRQQVFENGLKANFINSQTPIQSFLLRGNEMVKSISRQLAHEGFNVKPILSPTVPEGNERLRFCLHSFNSEEEITQVIKLLKKYSF